MAANGNAFGAKRAIAVEACRRVDCIGAGAHHRNASRRQSSFKVVDARLAAGNGKAVGAASRKRGSIISSDVTDSMSTGPLAPRRLLRASVTLSMVSCRTCLHLAQVGDRSGLFPAMRMSLFAGLRPPAISSTAVGEASSSASGVALLADQHFRQPDVAWRRHCPGRCRWPPAIGRPARDGTG